MERNGFGLDKVRCLETLAVARNNELETLVELDTEVDQLGKPDWLKTRENCDEVWSSHKQLLQLFDELGFPRSPYGAKGKLKPGKTSTDWGATAWIAKSCPRSVSLLNSLSKLKRIRSSAKYLQKLPEHVNELTGRVHPVTGPESDDDDRVGAISGRLGMKNPEGQQIPKRADKDPYSIRSMIIPAPGNVLVAGDYSALEVVLLADTCKRLFKDTQLEEMTATGAPDIHSVNARKVFGDLGWKLDSGRPVSSLQLEEFKSLPEASRLRDMVKAVWYGLMYGKGAYGFGNTLMGADGRPIGEKKAEALVAGFLRAVPAVAKYQAWVLAEIKKRGEVRSLAGRRCHVRHLVGNKATFGQAYRRCLNFPMQAGGADVVSHATIAAARELFLVLQVHDELVVECPASEQNETQNKLKKIMVDAGASAGLIVNLQVSVGGGCNWHECK